MLDVLIELKHKGQQPDLCTDLCTGRVETGEMQRTRYECPPSVRRGQRGDQGPRETPETYVVVLITQRSRVQIPPPLPGKTAPEGSFPGPFSATCDQTLGHTRVRSLGASPRMTAGSPASSSSCCASPTGYSLSAATPEARPRRPFNEQEATLTSNQRRRRPAPRSLQCGTFAAQAGCRPANVSRAQPTPVTMKRGDHLPTRVLDGSPGRQQLGGVDDKTPHHRTAGSTRPEPGTRLDAPDRCDGS